MAHRRPRATATALLLVCVLLLVGCASAAERHPAARAVDSLLKTRSRLARDAKAYVPYVKDSQIASALAEDASATAASKKRPVPEWRRPYVSAVQSTTADVVVVWKDIESVESWSVAANVFTLELVEGRWLVIDAASVEPSNVPTPLLSP